MDLTVTTLFDAPPERIWEEIQRPAVMQFASSPLVTFEAIDPSEFPEQFNEAEYCVELKLFGVLPMGTQSIRLTRLAVDETPGEQFYQLQDDGTGELVSTWNHVITLRETSDGKTVYTDEVEIDAGMLTLLLWLFANVFYRHRQRRCQRLVANGFDDC